ncbi:SIMPL domain-containing protein [Actinoplanes sp. CA-142083]|uniref:SIMPL domain-containing protein n=1 Tax=Actinoplanes sp. CA-142083 TaxID=3239903 RepID=UPI003D8C3FAC
MLVVLGLAGGRPAFASDSPPVESVQVTGTGEVFGVPDLFTANFAVEVSDATVGGALDRADAAATRVRDALVRAGVARADLQTSDVGISTKRDDHQAVTGYTVNEGLTAKIRDLPQAGAVMSAAIKAGGDAARLNGASFSIEDDAALLMEARKKAFDDARGKAELYARAAGRPLGRVLKVSEETPRYGNPYALGGGMAAADSAMPIEPGRHQLVVTVVVEWALGDNA